MFDITNPAHLLTLKTHGNTFTGLGTNEILDQFNLSVNNPAPESGPDRLIVGVLLNALYPVAISSQDQFKIQLVFEVAGNLSDDLSQFRAVLSGLSTNISTALVGITRPLSWAESTFGVLDVNGSYEAVNISRDDWFAARDSL